jgi:hypothetical protein
LAGWTLWIFILRNEAGQDWMVFHTAARAWFTGDLVHVFDGRWMTDTINQRYADWLERPLNYHPWLYPPSFLMLLVPFGWLSFGVSYALFVGLTFLLLLGALISVPADGLAQPDAGSTGAGTGTGNGRTIAAAGLAFALGILLFPQTAFIAFTGQNSFLTGAILVAGITLLDRRPVLAGVFLGMLTYKPQLFLMVPIALLAGSHWKAIASGIVTAAVLAVLSLALFGPDLWLQWLQTLNMSGDRYAEWSDSARRVGQSVFACLLALGVNVPLAEAAQAVVLLASAAIVAWAFRRRGPVDLRLMMLLAAAVLAAPHLSSQDAILLAAASLLLLRRIALTRAYPGERLLIAGIWIVELFDPPAILFLGIATPLVIGLFLAATVRRLQTGG